MKKKGLSLFLCLLFLLSAAGLWGCSSKNSSSEEQLKELLSNFFTPLSEEEYSQWENYQEQSPELSPSLTWAEKRFHSYMSDSAYQSLLQTSGFMFPVFIHDNQLSVTLQDLDIQKENNRFSFQGTLSLSEDQKSSSLPLEGSAQIDENGKITHLEFYQIQDIVMALSQKN